LETSTIRSIDLWLGGLGCLALTQVRRLGRLVGMRGPREVEPPRRILFLKLVEQGATVLAGGAFRKAEKLVGRDNVFFCCFEENRPIVDILEIIPRENVLTVRTDSFFRCVWDILMVILRARREKIDAVVDLEFFSKSSAVLAFLTGARQRVGMDRFTAEGPYRGDLLTHRMEYSPYVHTSITYSLLVEALTRSPREIPLCKILPQDVEQYLPRFEPSPAERATVQEKIQACVPWQPGQRLVLLNPNPSDSLFLRKWPAERFVDLAKRLLAEHDDLLILFIGTPSEREETEALCRQVDSPRVGSIAGMTSLRELIVLFTLADVVVTNDSGPAHFAALTPIEIVAMYGPETPLLFGPMGERVHVLHVPLACSPCLNVFNHRVSPCRNNVCIQSISVEAVHAAVQGALGSTDSRPAQG
jgi:ADP-heptose:LPS heptosyltransferase